jgi:nitronate monooxygenase
MPFISTPFMTSLGLTQPIVLGPMNNASSAELAAAVSNAGGLGSFAAALLSPDAIVDAVGRIRNLTAKPFNVNLFVLDKPRPDAGALNSSMARLQPYRDALGLGAAPVPEKMSLWAGQGVGLSRRLPAAELVEVLATETATAARALSAPHP